MTHVLLTRWFCMRIRPLKLKLLNESSNDEHMPTMSLPALFTKKERQRHYCAFVPVPGFRTLTMTRPNTEKHADIDHMGLKRRAAFSSWILRLSTSNRSRRSKSSSRCRSRCWKR